MDMSGRHVDRDLSAYLDEELARVERARVAEHLRTCDRCRARLADLRSTAALVAALPSPRPTRSLVPRVTQSWRWLRPVRSLSAFASGAFLFAFLVTAVAQSGGGLGGGAPSPFGGAPAAAPAPATQAERAAATAAGDAALKAGGPTATPGQFAVPQGAPSATAAPEVAAGQRDETGARVATGLSPSPLANPGLWLSLAILAALGATVAHLRLRRG